MKHVLIPANRLQIEHVWFCCVLHKLTNGASQQRVIRHFNCQRADRNPLTKSASPYRVSQNSPPPRHRRLPKIDLGKSPHCLFTPIVPRVHVPLPTREAKPRARRALKPSPWISSRMIRKSRAARALPSAMHGTDAVHTCRVCRRTIRAHPRRQLRNAGEEPGAVLSLCRGQMKRRQPLRRSQISHRRASRPVRGHRRRSDGDAILPTWYYLAWWCLYHVAAVIPHHPLGLAPRARVCAYWLTSSAPGCIIRADVSEGERHHPRSPCHLQFADLPVHRFHGSPR